MPPGLICSGWVHTVRESRVRAKLRPLTRRSNTLHMPQRKSALGRRGSIARTEGRPDPPSRHREGTLHMLGRLTTHSAVATACCCCRAAGLRLPGRAGAGSMRKTRVAIGSRAERQAVRRPAHGRLARWRWGRGSRIRVRREGASLGGRSLPAGASWPGASRA